MKIIKKVNDRCGNQDNNQERKGNLSFEINSIKLQEYEEKTAKADHVKIRRIIFKSRRRKARKLNKGEEFHYDRLEVLIIMNAMGNKLLRKTYGRK